MSYEPHELALRYALTHEERVQRLRAARLLRELSIGHPHADNCDRMAGMRWWVTAVDDDLHESKRPPGPTSYRPVAERLFALVRAARAKEELPPKLRPWPTPLRPAPDDATTFWPPTRKELLRRLGRGYWKAPDGQ